MEFDPIIESQGGKRISQLLNANNPHRLADQYITDIKTTSGGFANYQIVIWLEIDAIPQLKDEFTYTDEQYLECARDPAKCHQPSDVEYNKIITTYDLCGKRNSGEVDEIWMWDVGGMGFYESALAGPGAFFYNSPPITGTTCNKLLPIMGFNQTRGNGEMLEIFGHRFEATMIYVYGSWDPVETHVWNRFTLLDKDLPGKAGCGNIHFPHNGLSDYDYDNTSIKLTNCNDWYNYPNLTYVKQNLNCSSWNCTHYDYMKWWFDHLPKYSGKNEGKLNNWWYYVLDYENAKKAEVDPEPTPFPSNSALPTVLPSPTNIPTISPPPSYSIQDLIILIRNYLATNDTKYRPTEGKVNIMDAGWVISWLK